MNTEDRFVVDESVFYRDLQYRMNERARQGLLLVDMQCSKKYENNDSGPYELLYYTLVWYRPQEGIAIPLGYTVL